MGIFSEKNNLEEILKYFAAFLEICLEAALKLYLALLIEALFYTEGNAELLSLCAIWVYNAQKKKGVLWFKSSLKWAENEDRTEEIHWDTARCVKTWLPIPTGKSNRKSYDKNFISNFIRITITIRLHVSFFLKIMSSVCQTSLHSLWLFCEHHSSKFLFWDLVQ